MRTSTFTDLHEKAFHRSALWTARMMVVLLTLFTTARATASPPDVKTIVGKMKAGLEPARPSACRIDMTMHSPLGDSTPWVARQARKQLADGSRVLTVIVEPESVRGVALLIWERKDGTAAQWLYLPFVRRVRKVAPAGAYETFLNTDFTYYDLGFVGLHDRGFELLGEELHNEMPAYKVQEMPRNPWYYSRIVSWVAKDSFLPLQRDYYDPAGALWKTERFEEITAVDGVRTPLRITMEDHDERTKTELKVSAVRYDATIPDELFDPDKLPQVVSHPLWSAATSPAGPGEPK